MEFMMQDRQRLRDFLFEAGPNVYGGEVETFLPHEILFKLLVKSIYYQEEYQLWNTKPGGLTLANKSDAYMDIRQREWPNFFTSYGERMMDELTKDTQAMEQIGWWIDQNYKWAAPLKMVT
jgi:hypothetical protein